MTLSDTTPTRKQRFNAALALARPRLTKLSWRVQQGVSEAHLSKVLDERDPRQAGPELNAAIDALIAKWLPDSPEARAAAEAAAEESDEPTEAKIA